MTQSRALMARWEFRQSLRRGFSLKEAVEVAAFHLSGIGPLPLLSAGKRLTTTDLERYRRCKRIIERKAQRLVMTALEISRI